MSVLVVLWIGTLGVIYGSSYYEVSNRNREMLAEHVALYSPDQKLTTSPLPDMKPGTDKNSSAPRFKDTPAFQLSTFYSVAISKSGEILAVNNRQSTVYSNDELTQLASEIIESGKPTGTKKNLLYHMADKGEYTLVAFMDNTIVQESMTTLFRYTFIFGSLAIVALFFLSVFLARKIVQPLEESYQKQKQFISDAGHELKTPISIVSANAELLSRELGDDNPWLSNIQYENERMGMLVGQLLELARTETVTPQMEWINFSHLVGGEALPFESMIFEKGLKLGCEITDNLQVKGNGAQLKQLTAILLDNAICHSNPGKEILLTLKSEKNYAVLSVINDGDEIPAERRRQIFERFYRVDSARNSKGSHYGLGLAIARAIVITHKGKIDVSCHNGKVEFTVYIPLQK